MPIFLLLFAILIPRFVAVALLFFSNWFQTVPGGLIATLLGIVFLPYTFLWFSAVHNWYGGQFGPIQLLLLVVALLFDLGSFKTKKSS